MEREQNRIEPLKGKRDEREAKNLDSLSSLEVTNELIIPSVKSAVKSGCGKCG